MTRRYQVENQVTGIADTADTFEEIKQIREKNLADFLKASGAFSITIELQNDDGSWTMYGMDEAGEPIIPEH